MSTPSRSNRERTETTRAALVAAARTLFVGRGYGDTSTPDICQAAGITRGALYHHFADKRDLFRSVLAAEAEAVAADIDRAAPPGLAPRAALAAGTAAYLQAMQLPGRTRLLLVDGPAVLGLEEMLVLDAANAAGALCEGLRAAGLNTGGVPLDLLARLLSAAFDRAALEIDAGAVSADETVVALQWLLDRLLGVAAMQ